MILIEAKRWNGQWTNPGVLNRIKRKIRGGLQAGTVLINCEDANLTAEQLAYLKHGFTPSEVKFCGCPGTLPHPLPPNALIPKASIHRLRKRRNVEQTK